MKKTYIQPDMTTTLLEVSAMIAGVDSFTRGTDEVTEANEVLVKTQSRSYSVWEDDWRATE